MPGFSLTFVSTAFLIAGTLGVLMAACTTPSLATSAPANSVEPIAPPPVTTTSEPDRVATRVAEDLAVARTLTAVAKSAEALMPVEATSTLMAAPTSTPIPASTATLLPAQTNTPKPGNSPAKSVTRLPVRTNTPRPGNPSAPLDFNWKVESAGANPNNSGEWLAIFAVMPTGGSGAYSYFHDGLPEPGPQFPVMWRACRSKPGSISVRDGTGQTVKKDYFLAAPYCNTTPVAPPPVQATRTLIVKPPIKP